MEILQLAEPYATDVYPQAIVLVVLSGLVTFLTIPPLVWHSKHRNFAPAFLIACILINNVFNLVNAAVWPDDKFDEWWSGVGWCDIRVKIIVANSTALPAATICILAKLANVMDTKNIALSHTDKEKRRAFLLELAICLGVPALTMVFHFLVQPFRYFVQGLSGCSVALSSTWVTLGLLVLPPVLLVLINVYYAALIMIRLRLYRTRFDSILRASSTTKSRFLRLFLLSLTFIVVVFPVQCYLLFRNWPTAPQPFVWSEIHDPAYWAVIPFVPSLGHVEPTRWIHVACAFLVFVFFGLGKDAVAMYASWARAVGLGRLASSARRPERPADAAGHGRTSLFFGRAKGYLSHASGSSKTTCQSGSTTSFDSRTTTDLEMRTVVVTTNSVGSSDMTPLNRTRESDLGYRRRWGFKPWNTTWVAWSNMWRGRSAQNTTGLPLTEKESREAR